MAKAALADVYRTYILGLPVDCRRISFSENVFYRFGADRIEEVWSLIDRPAIEAQLARGD